MDDSRLRCSDAERDTAASKLQAHATAGRLAISELNDRLILARAAVTRNELARLLDDLPSVPLPGSRERASNADREAACDTLKDHWIAGRLTAGECEERLELVFCAVTYEELQRVLSDLPQRTRPSSGSPSLDSGPPRISGCDVVPAPDWPPKPLRQAVISTADREISRESSVTPAMFFWGALIGPVNCITLTCLWLHATSETWTPGTPAPAFLAAMVSVFLGLPVLVMFLLPFAVLEDRRNGRKDRPGQPGNRNW
jgi:hypothetical protein